METKIHCIKFVFKGKIKMKMKYFAYLHENNHWVVKCYVNKKQLRHYLEETFDSKSLVKGLIFPFEIEEEVNEEVINQDGLIVTCLADVQPRAIKDSPQLLYIKSLIEKIDWNKG